MNIKLPIDYVSKMYTYITVSAIDVDISSSSRIIRYCIIRSDQSVRFTCLFVYVTERVPLYQWILKGGRNQDTIDRFYLI